MFNPNSHNLGRKLNHYRRPPTTIIFSAQKVHLAPKTKESTVVKIRKKVQFKEVSLFAPQRLFKALIF